MENSKIDVKWMNLALRLAKKAAKKGEVPVAALIVGPDGLVSYAINTRERQQTPLGHAELLALHRASQKLNSWRLQDCTLYVTLEPCIMCAGAIQQSRIKRLVYGATDKKGGAIESLFQIGTDSRLNHQFIITTGILGTECAQVLKEFFQNRRKEIKSQKIEKIYRERTSVIVVHNGKLLGFHAMDPTSHTPYFFIPGGAIEPGESPIQSAARECLEETGYNVQIDETSGFEKKYDFQWNGKTYSCKTTFYLGFLNQDWTPPKNVTDAPYHRGVSWVKIADVKNIFSYSPDILWAVQKLLKLAKKKRPLR